MENNKEQLEKQTGRKLPETGMIQPSYQKYGGWYGFITGLDPAFFPTKKKASDWFRSLGVTPIYT